VSIHKQKIPLPIFSPKDITPTHAHVRDLHQLLYLHVTNQTKNNVPYITYDYERYRLNEGLSNSFHTFFPDMFYLILQNDYSSKQPLCFSILCPSVHKLFKGITIEKGFLVAWEASHAPPPSPHHHLHNVDLSMPPLGVKTDKNQSQPGLDSWAGC
jgi:hypothetical protein